MDAQLGSPSSTELDTRVLCGWSALESGDIDEARAVLRDVYTVDPTHPALPALAAGIRRARPRRLPVRGMVVLMGLLVAAALAWYSSSGSRVPVDSSTSASNVARPEPEQPTVPIAPAADPTGTAGRGTQARASSPATQPARTAPNDEAEIRQAISRVATAYSSRWAPMAFPLCDVARGEDTASVTCQSRTTQGSAVGESGGTWVFECRKIDGSWKIVSMQPPADVSPESSGA